MHLKETKAIAHILSHLFIYLFIILDPFLKVEGFILTMRTLIFFFSINI